MHHRSHHDHHQPPVVPLHTKQSRLRILPGPLLRVGVVFGFVAQVKLSNLRDEGVVRIRIRKQRGNRQENLRDRQRGGPLVLQNVEAYRAVGVDVAMINFRHEMQFRRLERVVRGEAGGRNEKKCWANSLAKTTRTTRPNTKPGTVILVPKSDALCSSLLLPVYS